MSDTVGETARRWWRRHQPDAPRPDAAGFAQLRRAVTPVEALMVPATHALDAALAEARPDRSRDWQALGVLAATLAHVRVDAPARRTAAIFGEKRGDRPVLSPLRFQRLLQADGWPARMAAFRRAIAVADGHANVADLADSLLAWTDIARTRWMFAYFGAPSPRAAEPAAEPSEPTEDSAP